MFKRALLAVAILGMVSAPATADMVGSLQTLPTNPNLQFLPGHPNGGTIGVLNTLGTFASSNVIMYPNASDVITVTFGIHQPYITPLLIERNRNGLTLDKSEVVIMGAGPAGPFVTNNIGTTPAAGAAAINSILATATGTAGVVGIEQFPAAPFVLNGSSTTPFFRVTFHATAPFGADSLLDLFAPAQGTTMTTSTTTGGMTVMNTNITQGVGLIFRTFTTSQSHTSFSSAVTNIIPGTGLFITGGGASSPSFGVELRPEPASAALLGLGALAMTGGFWRRRRRQA